MSAGASAPARLRWPAFWLLVAFCLPLSGLPFALSDRGAERWEQLSGLAASGPVCQIVCSALPGHTVVYVVVERWGVSLSEDGGLTWEVLNRRLPRGGLDEVAAGPLALAPDDAQFLLLGAAGQAAHGLPPLYKSGNGGQSWVPRRGLGAADVEGLAIISGRQAYAASGRHLFRSGDGGDTWSQTGSRPTESDVLALAVDAASGTVYVGTEGDGLWLTGDQGASWSPALPGRSVRALAVPDAGRVYAATDEGLQYSADRGASWQALLPTPEPVTALAVYPGSPDRLFVAPVGKPVQRSADGGATWHSLRQTPLGAPVMALAVDPQTERYLYVGTQRGLWRCLLPGG